MADVSCPARMMCGETLVAVHKVRDPRQVAECCWTVDLFLALAPPDAGAVAVARQPRHARPGSHGWVTSLCRGRPTYVGVAAYARAGIAGPADVRRPGRPRPFGGLRSWLRRHLIEDQLPMGIHGVHSVSFTLAPLAPLRTTTRNWTSPSSRMLKLHTTPPSAEPPASWHSSPVRP